MSGNIEKIFKRYQGNTEDGRERLSRTDSLEYYYTKKHLEGLIKPEHRILEIGCATGHYGFYYADKCSEYVGVDLYPPHIELFEKRIKERNCSNLSCRVADATALETLSDGSFDVVLSLGPMYHLSPQDRAAAFSEASRVCKKGGLLAFAYIVNLGLYAGACVLWRDIYPNAKANENVLDKGTDDDRPGLFYYVTPEELEAEAVLYGLKKIKNLATNFMFTKGIVDDMTDEQFDCMKPLYDRMAACESCTGMGNHALLICRKE